MGNNKKFWIIIVILLVVALALFAFRSKKIRMSPISQPTIQQPSTPCTGGACPSRILDLTNWKLTLPVRSAGKSSDPQEISQSQLKDYEFLPWFKLTADQRGVQFRAPVNAPTTGNTNYARSELREMTKGGTQEAFWPSTSGIHTLLLEEAITAVPKSKPDVVAGQIHGDDDDLLVIRLEYPKLFIGRGKSNLLTLDEDYTLGKKFTVKFVAEDGKIMVYYNGSADPVYVLEKKVKMAYFKVGVYTQSNCETEEDPYLCTDGNYGEVVVYRADLSHR
ncbi:MAG: polysaccharide lyase family 7 protein [Parcubacteria group bacterium]|jgi:hypothetical protein